MSALLEFESHEYFVTAACLNILADPALKSGPKGCFFCLLPPAVLSLLAGTKTLNSLVPYCNL